MVLILLNFYEQKQLVTVHFTLTSYVSLQAEMKRFANVDTSILKQHYDKKVQDLELEKRALQVCLFVYGVLYL